MTRKQKIEALRLELAHTFSFYVAEQLEVSEEEYLSIIDNESKFTEWERKYIIWSIMKESEKHKQKAILLFNGRT